MSLFKYFTYKFRRKYKVESSNAVEVDINNYFQINPNNISIQGDTLVKIIPPNDIYAFIWDIITIFKKYKKNERDCTAIAKMIIGRACERWDNPAIYDVKLKGHRTAVFYVEPSRYLQVSICSDKNGKLGSYKLDVMKKDTYIRLITQ